MTLSKSKLHHNVINHIKTISTNIENNINDNHNTLPFGDSRQLKIITQNKINKNIKSKVIRGFYEIPIH